MITGILFYLWAIGTVVLFVAMFWVSFRRRRRPVTNSVQEEVRMRGAQFESNASPKEAYAIVLGRAMLDDRYRNFTAAAPHALLFEGSRSYRDGGFLYLVQVWRRGGLSSAAVGIRWHEFHSDAEVHEAHLAFFEFLRSAFREQGYSFVSKWTLGGASQTVAKPSFGKRLAALDRPPDLKGELPATRRHFIVDGPDWATSTGINWLDGKGWRVTERLRLNPTTLRIALESEEAALKDGYHLLVETVEHTRQRVGVTLALRAWNLAPLPANLDDKLAGLEQVIRSNAAKILAE